MKIQRLLAVSLVALASVLLPAKAATFTVINTNDSGAGSLRLAIMTANGNGFHVHDTINFNIPGGGVKTISPLTPLPTITEPVTIDGTTQPGWALSNLVIELNGANAGANADGLFFSGITNTAPTSFVRGLAINRFTSAGIRTSISSNITIEGCHIGTNPTGTAALGGQTIGQTIDLSLYSILVPLFYSLPF